MTKVKKDITRNFEQKNPLLSAEITVMNFGSYLLLNGEDMWPRNGVTIQKGEKLLESIKERPVREQTNAFVCLHCSARVFPLDRSCQSQLRFLFLCQVLFRIQLIKLNSSTIDLQTHCGFGVNNCASIFKAIQETPNTQKIKSVLLFEKIH